MQVATRAVSKVSRDSQVHSSCVGSILRQDDRAQGEWRREAGSPRHRFYIRSFREGSLLNGPLNKLSPHANGMLVWKIFETTHQWRSEAICRQVSIFHMKTTECLQRFDLSILCPYLSDPLSCYIMNHPSNRKSVMSANSQKLKIFLKQSIVSIGHWTDNRDLGLH